MYPDWSLNKLKTDENVQNKNANWLERTIYEKLSVTFLMIQFAFGIGIAVGLYYLFHHVPCFSTLKDTGLQPYIVIVGGIPTVYLWIVNQRKKEQTIDLKRKEQSFNAQKELRERFTNIITQLKDPEQIMAQRFALRGLIDDWYNLDTDLSTKQVQMNQVATLLFNNRTNTSRQDEKIYIAFINDTLKNSMHVDKIWYSFLLFKLNKLTPSNIELIKKQLAYCDLTSLQLQDINFSNAVLEGSNLAYLQFNDTFFENANLDYADLQGSDFTGSIFTNATFLEANLAVTTFTDADLSGSTFKNTDVRNIDFSGATLKNATLSDLEFGKATLDLAKFNGADLSFSSLEDIMFEGVKFNEAVLNETGFFKAIIDDTDFSDSNLSEAILEKATVSNSCFIRAKLIDTKSSDATFTKSNFEKANLTNADFSNASLVDANLKRTNLTNTDFSNANLTGADLTGAKLKNTTFKNTDLTDTKFDNWVKIARSCNFQGAKCLISIEKGSRDTQNSHTNSKSRDIKNDSTK